jgi:hypothetical protein
VPQQYYWGLFFLLFLLISPLLTTAQCVLYPISLQQKVNSSAYIVLGKVTDQHTYIDNLTGNVNTLNKLEVTAWLKNHSSIQTVYVITSGGVYGNIATHVEPAVQLTPNQEYILMLEGDNSKMDDKAFRSRNPQTLQLMVYADMQGAFPNFNNSYKGVFDKDSKNERSVMDEISVLTGQPAKKPSGALYHARAERVTTSTARENAITSFSPNPTNAGTINPADFLTISGSGFGAAPGTVFFTNANDGGATFTASGVASDIISWADASITVKVADGAGTGPINVNGVFTSGSNLTISYDHIAINSTFSGFGVPTRQRYYLRNMNGAGGYSYAYNTTSGFSANTAAVQAFERALSTWRCGTFVNFRSDGTTTNGFADDNVNVVMFDGTLPAGVLGRATSRFAGSAIATTCDLANTVWCAEEIDFQFFPDPPSPGFTWEYGPATPSASEYDFQTVALHELGHAHGLGHVIAPAQVMHYAISNGAVARTLNANDIAGANAKMSYSTAATCFNPAACGSGPMTTLNAGNCLTLPLLLTDFNGERKGPSLDELNWITAQEENTKGFYIQRGSSENRFTEIGYVQAAGQSSQPIQYSYSDHQAGPYPWYYRLKMVDRDGKEILSPIIFIDGDKTIKWKVWTNQPGDHIYLYGNPASGKTAQLTLFGINGQQIFTRNIKTGNEEITVNHLSKGLYHYQLLYNGEIITGKLLLGN